MFGEKAARIKQLEAEVAAHEADAPYLAIAQEVKAEVGKLAMGGADLDAAFTRAIHNVTEERRMQTARDVFSGFPQEKQWTILSEFYGEDEIKRALEVKRQQESNRLSHTFDVHSLREQIALNNSVNLLDFPEGHKIALAFCGVNVPLKYRDALSLTERIIEGVTTSGGKVHVLKDYRPNDPTTGRTILPKYRRFLDHQTAIFGIETDGNDTVHFEQKLFFDAEVYTLENNKSERMGLDLAWVRIDGISLTDRVSNKTSAY